MASQPAHRYWLRHAMRERLEADERLAMLDVCIANHRSDPRKLLRLATARAALLEALERIDGEVQRLGGSAWMPEHDRLESRTA